MTIGDIATKARNLANTDSSAYTDANLLIDLNQWYSIVNFEILRSQDEWDFDDSNNTDFPILTTNIVANQQDYSLPTNALEIKRVEVTYDGVNWKKVEPLDISERQISTATNAIADFSASSPYYDPQYGSIFLYPIPTANVTGGLKVWVSRRVTAITSSDVSTGTLVIGFEPLFHDILAYGTAHEYCKSKDLFEKADRLKIDVSEKLANLRSFYSRREKDRVLSVNFAGVNYK